MEIGLLNKVYVLDHTHEVYFDKGEIKRRFIEWKLIGVFDSNAQAFEYYEKYKSIKGFKDSAEGLRVSEYTVDSIFNKQVNVLLDKSSFDYFLSELYGLYYVFEHPDGYEDVSLLGLFSSEISSQKAKELLALDLRFEKFLNYVKSFKHWLNRPQWEEGFVKWNQM